MKAWKRVFSCHLLTFLLTLRLTAFVMRVFCKAQQFTGVNIDEDLVCESVSWLIENQRGDGALPEVYRVIHGEMVVRKGTYELILLLPVKSLNALYLSLCNSINYTSIHNIVAFASFTLGI